MDGFDASLGLRQMAEEDRSRLHRRMDRAVSTSLTPIVLGRMLSHLPAEEVKAIEQWVVDEGALPASAARRLFGALAGAQQAGGFLQDAVDGVRLGAEELWVRLSEEFASRPEEINGSWANWLQGRPPSPSAQSVAGDLDEDDAVSVVSMGRRRTVSALAKAAAKAPAPRMSLGPQLGGGYPSLAKQGPKRNSCQLHCPAALFLFTQPGAAESRRRPSQQLVDFAEAEKVDKTVIEFESEEDAAREADAKDRDEDDDAGSLEESDTQSRFES
ncbi:unnamed protein product [Effrenium voratum]|uniref:Uncharacterized protein n=1 Tax=Effrenium voratum TaxID=2562239 RepID=A0AA36MH73_9DINO|nr:unnamed protein product [Effrenium voratum]